MTFKEMRKATGLTQFEMAVAMNCSLGTVQRYESGVAVAPELLNNAIRVARANGIADYSPNCPCCGRPL